MPLNNRIILKIVKYQRPDKKQQQFSGEENVDLLPDNKYCTGFSRYKQKIGTQKRACKQQICILKDNFKIEDRFSGKHVNSEIADPQNCG